jgi:RNA polymerase sigma-70 factor (ECF subfamily)
LDSLTHHVREAQRGDAQAFAWLHARTAGWVRAIALGSLSVSEAEDVVQEVALTAWRKLPDLRDPTRYSAWLGRIARNQTTDALRRRRSLGTLPDEELEGRAGDAPALRAEAAEALCAIRELPEAYRETLILRLVEGWSGPEIAARTGLTPGSVRVNLHRGMALLRERLGAG